MKSPTERPYLWFFSILALVGLVVDQTSKYTVFTWLYPTHEKQVKTAHPIIVDAFELQTNYFELDPRDPPLSFLQGISGERKPHVNRGALFGIGNEGGYNNLFMTISIGAAIFILIWSQRPLVAHDRFLTMALGLILGGTFGNLYDRVVFGGVRDFLRWHGGFEWPTFNIADCCLVCGACMLLVHSFFLHEEKTPEPENPASAEATVAVEPSTLVVTTAQGERPA